MAEYFFLEEFQNDFNSNVMPNWSTTYFIPCSVPEYGNEQNQALLALCNLYSTEKTEYKWIDK